jgi:hypothetical protein
VKTIDYESLMKHLNSKLRHYNGLLLSLIEKDAAIHESIYTEGNRISFLLSEVMDIKEWVIENKLVESSNESN